MTLDVAFRYGVTSLHRSQSMLRRMAAVYARAKLAAKRRLLMHNLCTRRRVSLLASKVKREKPWASDHSLWHQRWGEVVVCYAAAV